jgi:CRP-like cAMP-binding protein
MKDWDEVWYDEDAGPLVRLYARTGGRTVTDRGALELNAMVCRVPSARPRSDLSSEQSTILRLSRQPVSLSEIAVHLGMPVGPVRVLLGELRDAGLIAVPKPGETGAAPTHHVLERLLSGLRSL